uniref:HAUS augmin-like complex subunit 3 N-terminal domain-containing protein n=1 Tax=Crocodylus porosus TaxID=8502 RepID=A0A7M4G3L4_CROPO
MSCSLGAEFVETLKTIYPKADILHEKDFDWLFDCPKTETFLEWFCNTVGEENVLSPTEVAAYQKLLSSGKPILEGKALDQVLQTCHQSPQLIGMMPEEEGPSLEDLKHETQALQSYNARQLQRRNKLQIRAASVKQELCHLEEEEEKAVWKLRKAQLDLEVENSQTNIALNQACKTAKQLVEWHSEAGKGRLQVLMSAADLSHYMETEKLATGALEGFIQKVLCQNVVEMVIKADQMILEKTGSPNTILLENLGSHREELGRLKLVYICSQRQLITTLAEMDGICTGLQWARTKKENWVGLEQLQTIHSEIDQTQANKLMPLLQAGTHFFCLPILSGELNVEAVHLGYIASRQKEVAVQLIDQHSRLELLELQLMLEERQLHKVGMLLEEMVATLQEDSDQWQLPSLLSLAFPSFRLWEMLEKYGHERQLFRTYETLAGRGSRLCQEARMLEVQLAVGVPKTEHSTLDVMDYHIWILILHPMDYRGQHRFGWGTFFSLLLLQFCSTFPIFLQELSELKEQLSTSEAKLYQMLMDLLSDLKAKRKSLRSHFQQTERDLYVHFFSNVNHLQEVVQELEEQDALRLRM